MINKFIYLDSKISGALKQLIDYFNTNIFIKEDTIVIIKLYEENHFFFKELIKNNIQFIKVKQYSDLPSLKNSIIFYLFNAQSNCRLVAYREAKHIFVTHGESNKVSSIKPILRIYDYVIVAGDIGILRLLSSNIFTQCDRDNSKIIKMGNTFIGEASYNHDSNSDTILYAPTWEGGIKEENYSSINNNLDSFKFISQYAKKFKIRTIIVQPHPNSGHRNLKYLFYLFQGIKYLQKNFEVKITHWESNYKQKIALSFLFKKYSQRIENISYAFCDISAMEVQLLDKNIPTFVFFNETKVILPNNKLLKEYYKNIGIYNFESKLLVDKKLQEKIKNLYICYEKDFLEKSNKITALNWLCKKVLND